MLVNVKAKTISFKIVYYGAAMSGKTTNVRYIADRAQSIKNVTGEMISLATRGERTLFFDTVQLNFGEIGGYKTQFNVYTTPGQMSYITKRRLVLQGADAIVFVMDSQTTRQRDNLQSWYSLERQLFELKRDRRDIPLIAQLNKRDMPYVASVEQLMKSIRADVPHIEAAAETGAGVFPTLKWAVDQLVDMAQTRLTSSVSQPLEATPNH